MPRRYDLGKRADEMARTRTRIVDAAIALIRERGTSAATVPAIARAADVAPATVRNHFPVADALMRAVADAVLAELRLPGPEIFEGLDTLEARVHRLATELDAFSRRGEDWWRLYTTDPGLNAAWGDEVRTFERRLDSVMRAALGPPGDDDVAVAVLSTAIGPPLYYALLGSGARPEEAVDIGVALVVPWLEARAAARADQRTRAGSGSGAANRRRVPRQGL
ncbi:MAG TPA: TetR/AcrR family transcriptional regulator [Candidatus Limnocylindrales bacterium]|nr:TetR/AcrR family transcriptional regulator [Candidatus Limnocylindrales bacterium]